MQTPRVVDGRAAFFCVCAEPKRCALAAGQG